MSTLNINDLPTEIAQRDALEEALESPATRRTIRQGDLPPFAHRMGEAVLVMAEDADQVTVYAPGRGPVVLDLADLIALRSFLSAYLDN